MDKHSHTELSPVCPKHWALGSIFHCPRQASRWDSEDVNQGKEVGTYRGWFRAPELGHKADDVNSHVWSYSWERLGLWGVKGAQQEAGLSAIHIILTFLPLHIDSAGYIYISISVFLRQEQPRVLTVSKNIVPSSSAGSLRNSNRRMSHLTCWLSLTQVEHGLLSS